MVIFCRHGHLPSRSLWVAKYNQNVSDFYLSSFQREEAGASAEPMLVVRAILTTLAVAILIWSFTEAASPHWFIYLTNWGQMLLVLMLSTGLNVSIMYVNNPPKKASTTSVTSTTTKYLPWYVSIYWAFFNISITTSFMITLLYWTLLYSPEIYQETDHPTRMFWLDVMTHAVTSGLAIAELLISRTPVCVSHIIYPLGLSIVYVLFTLVYYLCGGKDSEGNKFIYDLVNWHSRPTLATIVAFLAITGVIAMYVVLLLITYCRDKLLR